MAERGKLHEFGAALAIVLVGGLVAFLISSGVQSQPVDAQVKGQTNPVAQWRVVRYLGTTAVANFTFNTCSGFGSRSDVIEDTASSGGAPGGGKTPGRAYIYDVICDRPVLIDKTLYDWRQNVILGQTDAIRSTVIFSGIDSNGVEVQRWETTPTWPVEYIVAFDREIAGFTTTEMKRIR